MDDNLSQIKKKVYDRCSLKILDYVKESESQEYSACRFKLNGQNVLSRTAKVTPKKVGQFVTFWKRKENGPIEPYDKSDQIDFYIVNVSKKNKLGQFVFPKSLLIKKGIISTEIKEGKRAFRVYPKWDITKSKQAQQTQKWQLNYFYEINDKIDFESVLKLYTSQ
ncbi:MepB family protein [Aquimarina sp. AD1]|uniref:MepB family protein n=1 Tax=Aquimarina TaxID=290174 RepID=UPI0003F8976B|nr:MULTISPECIES: MepB family protein [Aquimarina]AXT54500.1 MepB family protein [Aquimarina sp. AD1]